MKKIEVNVDKDCVVYPSGTQTMSNKSGSHKGYEIRTSVSGALQVISPETGKIFELPIATLVKMALDAGIDQKDPEPEALLEVPGFLRRGEPTKK